MGRKVDENSVRDVAWEEPPERTTYDWNEIARKLKRRPMKWAKIFDQGPISVSNAVRQGSVAPVHPDLGFQVRTANNTRTAPRTNTLYVRYNPDAVRDELRETIRSTRQESEG